MKLIKAFSVAMCVLITGCSFGPAPAPPIAIYDFGVDTPKLEVAPIDKTLALDDVDAPVWMHSSAIVYRLSYRNIAQLQSYALSRWSAAPQVLVTHRLRSALGKVVRGGFTEVAEGVHSDYVLRLELENFVQVVDTSTSARGVIRARASLIDAAQRRLHAQRVFEVEQPSPSVDAPGAVRALRAATDVLIAQIIDWTARQTKSAP